MKKTILVDLGIVIEYLKTGKGVLPKAYENYKMQILSTTYSALLASKTFEDAGLEQEVIEFVKKYFEILNVDEEIGLEAARVIRTTDLPFASAVVAAASIVKKMDLLTDDQKSFGKIGGVNLLSVE